MGSPKYMSPEQIRGEHVDARVDVYALGVMMYEMLTGKVPFDRANSVNILMAHIQEQVPLMSEHERQRARSARARGGGPQVHGEERRRALPTMDDVLAALKQCGVVPGTMSGEQRLDSVDNSSIFDARHSPISATVQVANDSDVGPDSSARF